MTAAEAKDDRLVGVTVDADGRIRVVHRGGLAISRVVVRPDLVSDHAPVLGVGGSFPAVLPIDPHFLTGSPSRDFPEGISFVGFGR